MKKEDIKATKVFMVDGILVIAETIQQAIEIYETNEETPYNTAHNVQEIKNGKGFYGAIRI